MSARAMPGFYVDEQSVDARSRRRERQTVVRMPGAQRLVAILQTTVQFIWAAILLTLAVVKIFTDSFLNYINHLTFVSWTLNIAFYAATALGPVAIAYGWRLTRQFVTFVLAAFLMPLFGLVVAVAFLVFVLIGTDAGAVTASLMEYSPEQLIIGNEIEHVIPLIVLLLFIGFTWQHVFIAVNYGLQRAVYVEELVRDNMDTRPPKLVVVRYLRVSWPLFIYQSYVGTLIFGLFYVAVFDPRVIYGTDISFVAGFLLLLLSLTFSNALPLLVGIYAWGLGTLAITIAD